MVEALLKRLSPQGIALPEERSTRAAPHICNTQATPILKTIHIYSNGLLSSILVKRRILIAGSQPTENHPGRRRNFAYSPRTEASSSATVDLVAPVLLLPLLPGGAAAASCSPPSRRVGEWTPHQSDCSTARPMAPYPASRRRSGEAESSLK
jgi:hypothetical protein